MEDKKTPYTESLTSSTVSDLQKEAIRKAILTSVEKTPYYKGLEIEACEAISAINRFSDATLSN